MSSKKASKDHPDRLVQTHPREHFRRLILDAAWTHSMFTGAGDHFINSGGGVIVVACNRFRAYAKWLDEPL